MPNRITEWDRWWPRVRDFATWALGAGLLIYETLARNGQDQALLVVVAGLVGLPVVVRADERRRSTDNPEKSE